MTLTNDDLKNIRQIIKEEFKEGFHENFNLIWEHNLDPVLTEILEKVDTQPSQHHVDTRFDALEKSMTEKITEPSITRDRKLDEKTNVVAQKLGVKAVFTREEVIEVEHITPFAVKPVTQ